VLRSAPTSSKAEKSAVAGASTAARRPIHAIHVPDSRMRMDGIDPTHLFGRIDVDVNRGCILAAAGT